MGKAQRQKVSSINKKCWICGKKGTKSNEIIKMSEDYNKLKEKGFEFEIGDLSRFTERTQQRVYCEECFKEIEKQKELDIKEYQVLRKKLMLERAIKILEKQNVDIYEYKEAIEAVQEYSQKRIEAFESAHEMVAAIILISNEVHTKVQYKIGKYRADFYLPELKIVLEVDGGFHEKSLYKDNGRDIDIRIALGREWEVVRIKTEYLEKKADLLVEAIKTIKEEKQKIRKENGGILPEWYSKRQKAKKPKKQEYGDEMLIDL